MKLKEYYRLNNYDAGGGYGRLKPANSVVGDLASGREIHIYELENEEYDEDAELDDYVNDIVAKKVDGHRSRSDLGNRKDNATLVSNNHMSIMEFAGDHQTYAMSGMSPRLTFRSKTNAKGPGFGTQANATYIRNRPGRKSGTQFGTSRKHKLLTDIEDNNIFNLSDLLDPMERSFKRHNNKTKKIISMIKEYLIRD